MGAIRRPNKVRLVIGLLASNPAHFDMVKPYLQKAFGKVDYESPVLKFNHTDYYKNELGASIVRKFFSFAKHLELNNIHMTKIRTNAIERRFLNGTKRLVNIDPGYLDLSKLVLFSTKDYTHRIHLGRGIYAEVTLYYKDKKFNSWPWTYPDYKTCLYGEVFESIRNLYKDNIKG